MTLNITEGCYVKLRSGSICGPISRHSELAYQWTFPGMSWLSSGAYYCTSAKNDFDIIEVLPGKPVFIDTPFEVGKTYRMRGGGCHIVTGFALRLCNGSARYLNGKNCAFPTGFDLLLGAIEDEEEVTVTMPKADYERAMELLKGAKE